MYIISPLSQCRNPEKTEIFMGHIAKIAPVSDSTEPKCHAYAWFRSAQDNENVPMHWLRGFEVYQDIEANTVAHRSSVEYKAFRKACSDEALLARPSDLRFWRPIDVGFMNKSGSDHFTTPNNSSSGQYIIVDELSPRTGSKAEIVDHLRQIAESASEDATALTFWVLDRVGLDGGVKSGDLDDGVYVIARFKDKASYEKFHGQYAGSLWRTIESLCESRRTTTWIESGVGFIGR